MAVCSGWRKEEKLRKVNPSKEKKPERKSVCNLPLLGEKKGFAPFNSLKKTSLLIKSQ
jgi:hypothetical protein